MDNEQMVSFTMVNMSNIPLELQNELAFTQEELAELERAKKMPITFDADCPETTPERALKFRRVNPPRKRANMASIFPPPPTEKERQLVLTLFLYDTVTLPVPFGRGYLAHEQAGHKGGKAAGNFFGVEFLQQRPVRDVRRDDGGQMRTEAGCSADCTGC